MSTRGNRKTPAKKRGRKVPMARTADKYELYLKSVQAPDFDVAFFNRIYKAEYGRPAMVLREDFCGTAAVCCEWAKSNRERVAYGIDLDPEPLGWGKKHNLSKLADGQRDRVHLVRGNVLTAKTPKADVLAAQNFSYFIFKTREELRKYFAIARKNIAPKGLLILDLFGGHESMEDNREEATAHDGFDYVWDQDVFDPITHFGSYYIHFRFPDKSEMKRAFSYHWRLWSIPEVREIVLEAGFKRADVYWEDTDHASGEGTGTYRRRDKGVCDPAWNAYVIGVK